jgi:hypothetical protein
VIVIDDFLPDFELAKRFIADVEYSDYEFGGKWYTGVGQVTLPVKALIEREVGPIKIKHNHLRIGRKDTPLTHYIHTDNYGTALAMVLCLQSPDCVSGTAFWRHKETGLDRLELPDTRTVLDSEELCSDAAIAQRWRRFAYFDKAIKDESAWEMTELVESIENRALIFDANMFHSRWPKTLPVESGDKPRIVCTVFFDRLQNETA